MTSSIVTPISRRNLRLGNDLVGWCFRYHAPYHQLPGEHTRHSGSVTNVGSCHVDRTHSIRHKRRDPGVNICHSCNSTFGSMYNDTAWVRSRKAEFVWIRTPISQSCILPICTKLLRSFPYKMVSIYAFLHISKYNALLLYLKMGILYEELSFVSCSVRWIQRIISSYEY